MRSQLQNIYFDVYAIYEPDGSDTIWGKWHCAAVDMFSPEFTFQVYFTLNEDGTLHIEHVERWHFR